MIKVQFNKDFATRKKGDVVDMNSMLASDLVKRKIVKKVTQKKSTKK